MKLATLLFALLLGTSFNISAQNNVDAEPKIGRYVIVFGTAQLIALGAPKGVSGRENAPIIIRLDTATGKTWELVQLFADNQYKEFWKEISEHK